MSYDKASLTEKVSSVSINTDRPLDLFNLDFFFDYKIFPSSILTYWAEWQQENRRMKTGDTIVQQVYLPPLQRYSQKLVFGVRICQIIDEPKRKSFSYETLQGHVEKGISTFSVEQENNKIVIKIHTFSAPGHILSRLLGPVFSLPYQAFCTRRALAHMKRQIELQM